MLLVKDEFFLSELFELGEEKKREEKIRGDGRKRKSYENDEKKKKTESSECPVIIVSLSSLSLIN